MSSRFAKFSERAQKVLNISQEEAERFNHNFVDPEHILLGIVREGNGIAAKALVNLGLELDQVRQAVESSMRRGKRVASSEIVLSPKAKIVIEFAVDENRQLHNTYIGTEHLLLGLLREGTNMAALEGLGVTLEEVRTEVVHIQRKDIKMEGKLWLNNFTSVMSSEIQECPEEKAFAEPEWTEFMTSVMDGIGKKMNCYVAHRRPRERKQSGEYLNIDAFFIDQAAYERQSEKSKKGGYDPFVLPRAVAELENDFDHNQIAFCLWKIVCVRSPIRALICYQEDSKKILKLKRHLEEVVLQEKLMKDDKGSLFIIIGDESKTKEKKAGKYTWRRKPLANVFHVYEWKNHKLVAVEGLKW